MPQIKYYNGTSWVALDANDAQTLGGNAPSYYATASNLGTLTNLNTNAKSDTVSAINENVQSISDTQAMHWMGL